MAMQTRAATRVQSGDALDPAVLAAFAEEVLGEWTGYEGVFCSETGSVLPVPDYYIPDEFVEWGLVPKGFASNHSIIVRGETLYRKFFRVLPTVSVFADHVDLEENFVVTNIAEESAMHIFPDGSFSGGPSPVCVERNSILDKWPAVDFCVRDPRPGADNKQAVHVRFAFDFAAAAMVDNVTVIHEKHTCIYCDGADIEGSSGFVEGWVVEEPSAPEHLTGEWVVEGPEEKAVARPDGGPLAQPGKQIYLPKGIDVAVERVKDGANIVARVGWLVEPDTRVVMTRSFDADGTVLSSQHCVEVRC